MEELWVFGHLFRFSVTARTTCKDFYRMWRKDLGPLTPRSGTDELKERRPPASNTTGVSSPPRHRRDGHGSNQVRQEDVRTATTEHLDVRTQRL